MDRTELLSQILDSLPVFIGLVNERQEYEFVNSTYETRFGVPREEIVGKTVKELNGPEQYEGSRPQIEAALSGQEIEFEYEYGGRAYLMKYQPRWQDDQVTGYFVISTDITQLKRAASQLEQNRDELKVTRSSFENFASFTHYDRIASVGAMAVGFAHDISQPISVMNILVDPLKSSIKGTIAEQSARQKIDNLQAQVQYTADLINRLRQFSTLRGNARQQSDLNQILVDSVQIISPRARSKEITLDVVTHSGIALAFVDPIEIQQILVNLIANAIESVSGNLASQREIKVIGRLDDADTFVYRIIDNGSGVSEEMLERLFEAFASDKESGIGIGLSISQILAENNGGTLEFLQPENGGAEFVCRIPLMPTQ
jgi:PAS domain S-box-containing protein